jgi:hypothetical protein
MTAPGRRVLDPFDVMRATRSLAPHDVRLNDMRWLIGEALRRLHARAKFDTLRSPVLERAPASAPQPFPPLTDKTLAARERLRQCEREAGAASWPILVRVIIEGARLQDCRGLVPEVVTPWRADAVLADRLRTALDRIAPQLGIGERG